MTGGGGSTPDIPGFQPLHIRGGGRLGIWIEARQIRLDRRVLLKVLPATDRAQQEQFIDEIQALVKLDGDGVLRVIDEGAVAQARYVALDEAEGQPIQSTPINQSGLDRLGSMLVKLHQQLHQFDLSIEAIDPDTLLQLPSGDFAARELGVVSATTDLLECQAQAARSLELTATSLKIEGATSRRWSDAMRKLRSGEPSFESTLDLFQNPVQKSGRQMQLGATVATVLLLIGVVWMWSQSTQQQRPDGGGGNRTGEGVIAGSEDDPGPPIATDGGSTPPRDGDQGVEVSPRIDSEGVAQQRWQRHQILVQAQQSLEGWQPRRDDLLEAMQGEQFDIVRLQLEWIASSSPEQASRLEMEAVQRAVIWVEQRRILEAKSRAEAMRSAQRFGEAADILEALAQGLALQSQFSAEIDLLKSTARSFDSALVQLEAAMEQTLQRLASDPEAAIESPQQIDGFSALQRRWNRFERSCLAAASDARGILDLVGSWQQQEKVRQWVIEGGDSFEARVIDFDEAQVWLRRKGRRSAESHRWSEIDGENLKELLSLVDVDGAPLSRRLEQLQIVWGTKDSPLDLSKSSFDIEVRGAADRLRWQQIQEWLRRGERALQEEEVATCRSLSLELVRWLNAQEIPALEKKLLQLWAAPVRLQGPEAVGLFPGAVISDWDEESGSVQLVWSGAASGDQGLQGSWASSVGSHLQQRKELIQLQGRIVLVTPVRFESTLEVEVVGLATREDAPNLNVVFWEGSPEALLFGVGVRPPEVSSIRVGEADVLLPAHAIVEEEVLAAGGGEMAMPEPLPRVRVGKPVRIFMREDGEGSQLKLNGKSVVKADPRPGNLRGSIAFETFQTPVVIREISLRGQICRDDWLLLLQKEARQGLQIDP